eukprot:TRINITY_DN13517_c0_g2_i1.p1 TRINITY_DN13517_c0_g2~~TRINITY_DN13517_c0_g2_i1.p1  ORF type:complete len:447 (+),score=142.72 TRINITY_DN13517_c0_g2_i1:124-1464(+)
MHENLMKRLKNFSPKSRKQKYRNAGSGATENFEEMYLEIAHWIANEMNSKIDIKSREKGTSQFSFGLPNAVEKPMDYIAKKNEELVKAVKEAKEEVLNAIDDELDIPTEQETSGRDPLQKYLFTAKSTPEFNKRRQILSKASSIKWENDKVEVKLEPKKLVELKSNAKNQIDVQTKVKKFSDLKLKPKAFFKIKTEFNNSPVSNKDTKNTLEEIKGLEQTPNASIGLNASPNSIIKLIQQPKELEPEPEPKPEDKNTLQMDIPKKPEMPMLRETSGVRLRQHRERKRRTTLQEGIDIVHIRALKSSCVDDSSSCRILIADDNMSNRFILKSILHKCGLSSIEAQNGSDALGVVQKYVSAGNVKHLLLVFMDLQMPVMNGIEATKAIIELCNHAGAITPPIIGVSSDSLEEDRAKFLAAGINEFISKPLDKGKIESVLNVYIKRNVL